MANKGRFKQDLGLKCSAWKVFGSKDFGMVGLEHKTKQDLLGQKFFETNKNWGHKIRIRKNLGPNENFVYRINFWVQKSFWVQKFLGLQNNFGHKKVFGFKKVFWIKKVFGSKKDKVQTILGLKNLC